MKRELQSNCPQSCPYYGGIDGCLMPIEFVCHNPAVFQNLTEDYTHKLHQLKIGFEFALPKAQGNKPFEIRKNDRDFHVDDLVAYTVIDKQKAKSAAELKLVNDLETWLFRIVYITDYKFGLRDGYVVFAEKRQQ